MTCSVGRERRTHKGKAASLTSQARKNRRRDFSPLSANFAGKFVRCHKFAFFSGSQRATFPRMKNGIFFVNARQGPARMRYESLRQRTGATRRRFGRDASTVPTGRICGPDSPESSKIPSHGSPAPALPERRILRANRDKTAIAYPRRIRLQSIAGSSRKAVFFPRIRCGYDDCCHFPTPE